MEKEENIIPQQKYSPIAVANTFIAQYGKDCADLSHMKLQKLVYMVHGWWLAYNPENPILDEKPQVWPKGPVFNSMYHILKTYGMRPLKDVVQINFSKPAPIIDDEFTKSLIEWVWNRYGHRSAEALSEMTHEDGTAWKEVARKNSFSVPKNFPIEDCEVTKEFSKYLNKFLGKTA